MKRLFSFSIGLALVGVLAYSAYDYALNDRGFSSIYGKSSSNTGVKKGSMGVSHSWMNR